MNRDQNVLRQIGLYFCDNCAGSLSGVEREDYAARAGERGG